MTDVETTPEFIIVQDDAVVLMDMRDLIVAEFQRLPLCLDDLEPLTELLDGLEGSAVVIAACDPVEFAKTALDKVHDMSRLAVVLICDSIEDAPDFPGWVRLISAPFTSETLLESIRTALWHLRSFRT